MECVFVFAGMCFSIRAGRFYKNICAQKGKDLRMFWKTFPHVGADALYLWSMFLTFAGGRGVGGISYFCGMNKANACGRQGIGFRD